MHILHNYEKYSNIIRGKVQKFLLNVEILLESFIFLSKLFQSVMAWQVNLCFPQFLDTLGGLILSLYRVLWLCISRFTRSSNPCEVWLFRHLKTNKHLWYNLCCSRVVQPKVFNMSVANEKKVYLKQSFELSKTGFVLEYLKIVH
jgi:hypothetical protein